MVNFYNNKLSFRAKWLGNKVSSFIKQTI